MPKNDNAHALRLQESLRCIAGEDAAQAFAKAHPLSKSASIEKKFDWARAVCTCLEAQFDEPDILRIRKACRCNDGKSIADKLRTYLQRTDDLPSFVEAFNQHEHFASLVYLAERKLPGADRCVIQIEW